LARDARLHSAGAMCATLTCHSAYYHFLQKGARHGKRRQDNRTELGQQAQRAVPVRGKQRKDCIASQSRTTSGMRPQNTCRIFKQAKGLYTPVTRLLPQIIAGLNALRRTNQPISFTDEMANKQQKESNTKWMR